VLTRHFGTARRCAVALTILLSLAAPAAAQDVLCDPARRDQLGRDCRDILISHIRQEKAGLDVAFWFMEDAWIASEIINRHKAGVPVRILMDTDANRSTPRNAERLMEFQAAGIPMRERVATGILHWKMILFEGQGIVEFSGANFSPDAWTVTGADYTNYTDEAIYFTSKPSIVNSFRTTFDEIWVNTTAYRDYANVTATPTRRYGIFPIDPELNFVPRESYGARAVREYGAESQRIDVIMYRITDARHADAMVAAERRGVPVRLITEPQQYRDPVRQYHSYNVDRMYMAGVEIRNRAHPGLNHQKSVLLYRTGMTIFGSSNWTSASSDWQEEHNLFTRDASVFQWFVDQFERKWNNAAGPVETEPFAPLPPDRPALTTPAHQAANVPTSGVVLEWNGGYWSHLYDVHVGTAPTALGLAARDVPRATTGADENKLVLGGPLAPATTYYWRAVGRTMAGLTASSPIWSFTTAAASPEASASGPSLGSGDILLYAADATAVAGNWVKQDDATAAGGGAMRNPDRGAAKRTSPLAAPADYFELTFTPQPNVPYRLWMRGKADGDAYSNDSVFVQFSGTSTFGIGTTSAMEYNLEDCSGCGVSGWGWQDNGWGANVLGPTITFTSPGPHRLRVQVREDGLAIDQVLLSPSKFLSASPGALKNDTTIYPRSVTTPAPAPAPEAAALPSGWSRQDVGAVGVSGSASASGGTFTVKGAGHDIWGSADAFHYAWQRLSGDLDVVARVASVEYVHAWVKAGVMIRERLTADAPHALMLVSPGKGLAFQRRAAGGGLSTSTTGGAGTAPAWVKLSRRGNVITASRSADGVAWIVVGSDTFATGRGRVRRPRRLEPRCLAPRDRRVRQRQRRRRSRRLDIAGHRRRRRRRRFLGGGRRALGSGSGG